MPSRPGHAHAHPKWPASSWGTPLPSSPVSCALPSGTGPARPPSLWLAQSCLRGPGAALQTLQPHRLLPGHHLLQLFGDSQQLLFQAHVGPRRPAGLEGRRAAAGAKARATRPANTPDTRAWRGRGAPLPALGEGWRALNIDFKDCPGIDCLSLAGRASGDRGGRTSLGEGALLS